MAAVGNQCKNLVAKLHNYLVFNLQIFILNNLCGVFCNLNLYFYFFLNLSGSLFYVDKNQLNGNSINLITVYKSRCMNESKNGGFKSIFRETTRTYLYRMIGALTSDYKKDRIDRIFESGGKVKEWQLSPNYVNSILREGDGIEKGDCNDTTYNIEINFAGVSENMELQINTD